MSLEIGNRTAGCVLAVSRPHFLRVSSTGQIRNARNSKPQARPINKVYRAQPKRSRAGHQPHPSLPFPSPSFPSLIWVHSLGPLCARSIHQLKSPPTPPQHNVPRDQSLSSCQNLRRVQFLHRVFVLQLVRSHSWCEILVGPPPRFRGIHLL